MVDQAGYWELLRTNAHFRRLWAADVVSLLGDWFNTIALYTLVKSLTGSPQALGLVFAIKMGTFALCSPIAGVLADRYDRRRLMIGADLLRAVVVLGFLAVRDAGDVWLLYALLTLQIALGAVFRPARSASLPNLTSARELLTANALSAATWSTLLALGAGLGGFVSSALGTDAVFVIDAATYLVSAALLARVVIPQPSLDPDAARAPLAREAFGKLTEGWAYMRARSDVMIMALAKAFWASGGAALVFMLALLGPELTDWDEAAAIGLAFSVRGVGTGVGPILGRALVPDRARWPWAMGLCLVVSGLIYALVALMPWTLWVLLPVGIAHALSGANWVFSSVLLQERAEDAYRGRVFATEWFLLTLTNVVATLAASNALEYGLVTLRQAVALASGVIVLGGLLWWAVMAPRFARAPQPPA